MLDDATKKQIADDYMVGNSPQAIARTHRCSVEEVLVIIGQAEMTTVELGGDQIDQSEAGTTPVNYQGKIERVSYDTN